MNQRNHIDSGADLNGEILRIAARRIAGALKRLRKIEVNPDVAVHEVRKDLKRLRALVRLPEDGLGKRRHRKLQRDLRDAGRLLSHFRDSEVRLRLVERLRDQSSDVVAREALDEAVERIRTVHQKTAEAGGLEEAAAVAATLLRRARRNLTEWLPDAGDLREHMENALLRSHGKARLGMRRTLIHPVADHFHDWRKACKTLRHQLDLVLPAEVGEDQRIMELHELSEHLGNLNDLDVLEDALEPLAEDALEPLAEGALDIRSLMAVRRELEGRRSSLVSESWAMGERVFSRDAVEFVSGGR